MSAADSTKTSNFRRNAVIVAAVLVVAASISVAVVFATGATGSSKSSRSSAQSSAQDGSASVPATLPVNETLTTTPTASPTPGPTVLPSRQPSMQPIKAVLLQTNVTAAPSAAPISVPSGLPTQSPSLRSFGSLPVTAPSTTATTAGSGMPSELPSLRPTITMVPTTPNPTESPTETPQPTTTEISEDLSFRLKMHWEEVYMWQESAVERKYCIECTTCEELNFAEHAAPCAGNGTCTAGDQLRIYSCNKGGGQNLALQRVESNSYYQVRVVNSDNLCFERIRRHYVQVQVCNETVASQWWNSTFLIHEPFEINPVAREDDEYRYCMTQQHHPKDYEILGLKNCSEAIRYNTDLWEIYPAIDA